MDGFFIFLFIAFLVIRNLMGDKTKKVVKSTNAFQDLQKQLGIPPNLDKEDVKYAQKKRMLNRRALAMQLKQSGQFGHSDARQNSHDELHSQDNSDAFPDEHQAHVRARDSKDVRERQKMENTIHSKSNRGIIRVSNKSTDGWGAKGDTGLVNVNVIAVGLFLLVLLLIAQS